jgi:hypothetical protein
MLPNCSRASMTPPKGCSRPGPRGDGCRGHHLLGHRGRSAVIDDPDDLFDLAGLDRPLEHLRCDDAATAEAGVRTHIESRLRRSADAHHSADLAVFEALVKSYVAVRVLVRDGRVGHSDRTELRRRQLPFPVLVHRQRPAAHPGQADPRSPRGGARPVPRPRTERRSRRFRIHRTIDGPSGGEDLHSSRRCPPGSAECGEGRRSGPRITPGGRSTAARGHGAREAAHGRDGRALDATVRRSGICSCSAPRSRGRRPRLSAARTRAPRCSPTTSASPRRSSTP